MRSRLYWSLTATAWMAMSAAASAQEPALTLARALELAHARSPLLAAVRQAPAEARGELTDARLPLRENPELEASAGPRSASGADPGSTDAGVGIEQRFEIGGQRRHRIESAEARVAAAEAEAEEASRTIDLAVAETFYEAVAAQAAVELLEEAERLAAALEDAARRRLEAGEAAPLELNTARVRRAEAARQVAAARAAWQESLTGLAETLGIPPAEPLAPQSEIALGAAFATERELLTRALEQRPDLRAAQRALEAARAAVALADAEAVPDIGIAVSAERDEGQDVLLAGIRIPLPLVQRNQGERETSRATLARRQAELGRAQLAVEADVHRAWEAYQAALTAWRIYDSETLGALSESELLLEKAFAAGEVSHTEVVVVQRELLEGRLGRLEARRALATAVARLLAAAHLPQTLAERGEIR